MEILIQPDSLSMVGSMNPFEIYTTKEVVFVLRYKAADTVIVQHTYTPNDNSRITVKLKDIILPLLSFTVSDASEAYEQKNILKEFSVTITEVGETTSKTVDFSVIRAGVDQLADSADNFLQSNFLTWQPNVKGVTYYSPEFLTYYAQDDCIVKCQMYFWNGVGYEEKEVALAMLNGGKVWTIPVQYAVIAKNSSNEDLPSYYDVWVEKGDGTRLTYVQRYFAEDAKSEEEEWFLFENSLGGIDCFRAYGNSENTAEHTHNVAEIEEDSEEYRVDTAIKYKKHTGYLDERERQWLLDFFPSLGKYHYSRQTIRKITVTESDVNYEAKELPTDYSFTYKYSDARQYLNLSRTDVQLKEMNIHVPDVGNFTIAPRLVEFPRTTLSDGALFPFQNPYSEEWGTTTLAALYAQLVARLADGYKGGGGIGHTHNNFDLLDALTEFNAYVLLHGEKIKAGFADQADDFTENGTASGKILRKDREDAAEKTISFYEGLLVGIQKKWGINKEGDASLRNVVIDKQLRSAKATDADRTIIDGNGFDLYLGDDGKSHLYVDNLSVRMKAFFSQLEIRKVSYSGGTTIFSNAGSTIVKVSTVWDEAKAKAMAFKCYAVADDGTSRTMNAWKVGMQALCQTFNLKSGTTDKAANRYYWRLVVGKGQETLGDGRLYDYVILSNVEEFQGNEENVPTYDEGKAGMSSLAEVFESNEGGNTDDGGTEIASRLFYGYDTHSTDAPEVGDVIVQAGDQIRWQSYGNLIKLATSTEDNGDDTAPSITMYHNMGAPYRNGDTASPFQWLTVSCVISPSEVLFNSRLFKWFSGDPTATIDPITVIYQASFSAREGGLFLNVTKTTGSKVEEVTLADTDLTVRAYVDGRSDDTLSAYVKAHNAIVLSDYPDARSFSIEILQGATVVASDTHTIGGKGEKGDGALSLQIISDRGNVILNGEGSRTLTAHVFEGAEDITDTIPPTSFSWKRTSGDEGGDEAWNARHEGVGNVITVSKEDITRTAIFDCEVFIQSI